MKLTCDPMTVMVGFTMTKINDEVGLWPDDGDDGCTMMYNDKAGNQQVMKNYNIDDGLHNNEQQQKQTGEGW